MRRPAPYPLPFSRRAKPDDRASDSDASTAVETPSGLGFAARAAAGMAPVAAAGTTYGLYVANELSEGADRARAELEGAITAQRDAARVEYEAQLERIRAEGDALTERVRQASDQLQEAARVMVDRIESVAFDVRDDLNRVAARIRGESEERLDLLEDHVRAHIERARTEIESATSEAVGRIRAVVDVELHARRSPFGGATAAEPSGASFYLTPEQADDDDVDLE